MKGQIRNRRLVSLETTKYALRTGKSPDASLAHKIASRKLYDQGKYLTLSQDKRGHPRPRFERVPFEGDVLAWMPANDAARDYFQALSDSEKYEFMFHPPPEAKPRVCESKRVLDSRPIKALPNGKREADVFPNERAPSRTTLRSADAFRGPKLEFTDAEIDHIRTLVSQSG